MRLYLNVKEIEPLKEALRNARPRDPETRGRQLTILERVVICEQLQKNCDTADKT